MNLGERIALARKRAGLSQEQLGEKLAVSRQAVSKWESGQTNPDVAYLAQMCRVLGVSSDWLLLGEERGGDAPSSRCPGCDSVITGLEKFCPNCGYSLLECASPDLKNGRYTLVLGVSNSYDLTLDALEQFYRELPDDSEFQLSDTLRQMRQDGTLDRDALRRYFRYPPLLIAGNVDYNTALRAKTLLNGCAFLHTYPAKLGDDMSQLIQMPVVPELSSPPAASESNRSLGFGGTVLAVILGVVGALLLLSIL